MTSRRHAAGAVKADMRTSCTRPEAGRVDQYVEMEYSSASFARYDDKK
jgi:hypothetical protein